MGAFLFSDCFCFVQPVCSLVRLRVACNKFPAIGAGNEKDIKKSGHKPSCSWPYLDLCCVKVSGQPSNNDLDVGRLFDYFESSRVRKEVEKEFF